MSVAPSDLLFELEELHRRIDEAAGCVVGEQRAPLACRRGCSGCCVDGVTVFAIEAELIRRKHPALLDEGSPHPPGACAFLDGEGACRIYAERPYVCRTQGLPLRWLDEDPSGAVVEYRDICELNEPLVALTVLPPSACWPIGPVEAELAALERRRAASSPDGAAAPEARRVELRALFAARDETG
jgi:hypothetical protein